jgi:putative PEP-CTERM system TPR-repeat lipoprotein
VGQLGKLLLFLLLAAARGAGVGAADDPLLAPRQALDKGEVRSAVLELKSLLQKSPDNAEARLLLGETYIRQGDGPSAVKELEKARDLKLAKEKWISQLAQAYLLKNDRATLLSQLQPDPQLPAPVNAKLQALRGMAQMSSKDDLAKAQESFTAALQADPGSVEALLGLATLEIYRKQYPQASEYASQATAKAPKNAQTWLLLGEIKRLAGDVPAALDAFTRAVALRPNDVRGLLGRASVLIAKGNLEAARKDVDTVLKTSGEVPLALYTQGVIDFQSHKLDEAKENLTKVSALLPQHLPSLYLLGAIAYQKNELEQAENALSKVVSAVADNLPAIKLLAATRLKRGSPGGAIELLKPLADKHQDDAQLFAILGSAYLKNKQYDEGIAQLARAAQIAPDVASVRAELGLGKIAAGKMDQGVDDLKTAVGIDPKLIEADATIVLAMIQQKKYDEAIAEAKMLKARRKDDPLADNLLGAAYMAKGDTEHARESWKNALAIKPDYTPASLNLAKIAMGQNKPAEAAEAFEKILKYDPRNLSAFVGLAQLAEMKKDYVEMVNRLEAAIQQNPKNVTPALMLTRYYLAQAKGVKALEVANDAVGGNPDNPSALQNLGQAQMGANQAANAASTFKQLVAKLPDNPELHHQLAQALYKQGDKAGAAREWDEALKKNPEYTPALLAKAELALQDKQYGEVMKIANLIKAKFPKSPLGYQLEGDVHNAQKQPDKSVPAYEKAYELAPSSYLARRLFVGRRDLQQGQAAFDGLRSWLEKSGKDIDSWGLLASSLQESGQLKEALAAYEKAYELNPDMLVLQNNLAWLYQELGDKKALALAEKLASASGIENKVEILDTVGWVFLQNGKEDKGLVLLQQAAMQDPRNVGVRLHLATAFAKTGKKDEAKKELERLLKENKSFPERAKAEEMLKGI